MVKSMTGYGRAVTADDDKIITVEIKSVNSRYFDCTIKASRGYSFLEDRTKSYFQQHGITRGKVECYISIEKLSSDDALVVLDTDYAKSYIDALYKLRDTFGLKDDISVMTVAANRDLFTSVKAAEDIEKEWNDLLPTLDKAIEAFIAARVKEGANLASDIISKIDSLTQTVEKISALQDRGTVLYRQRLESKLAEILAEHQINIAADDARVITECAIFADKTAIDEEVVRLGSHFKSFREKLERGGEVGKDLDFRVQEMNREVNTIGSKCADIEISNLVIEAKHEIEKIREQIQNLE